MTRSKTHLLLFLACGFFVVASVAIGYTSVRQMQQETRGVVYRAPGDPASAIPAPVGVNAALEQYSAADLDRALGMIQASGFPLVRQHFYWNEIEPQRGQFEWTQWDRIVAGATEHHLDLVAVLDTTPEWARDPGERDLVNAAPDNVEDYGAFVAAFVRRYGDRIRYVQLWDNPNIHPYWGRRNASPAEYTALLRAGATAARAADPRVKVLSAGLAPNEELVRGHPDYADVLFLRGMYEAGARDYFDILGAEPYGMWTGPEDRRVAMDVFNFSRVILLHDEMVAHGDGRKPVWAVEFGWNALPQGWEGGAEPAGAHSARPSPWGSDTEAVQSARLSAAVARARSEWPWLTAMLVRTFQPNALADDPQWGFALVDQQMQPRPLLTAVTAAMAAPVELPTFDFVRFYATLALLALVASGAVWQGARSARRVPWGQAWSVIEGRFAALPAWAQIALLIACTAAFYFSRSTILNFALLALLVPLFALRLDWGLAITVFTVPFYLLPKNLFGSAQFSLVEILMWVSVAAFVVKVVSGRGAVSAPSPLSGRRDGAPTRNLKRVIPNLTTLDWAIVLFVAAGVVSVMTAGNFGVANREFRVIILEPALLYALIRLSHLSPRGVQRLVDALALSAVAVALIGLYQFFFTNYVIIGEGVRRILAVYGSPNNLALYLDRALPLLVALALYSRDARRRAAYTAAALIVALCWYLTYSRAAWLGVAAGLIVIALASGRRVRLAVIGMLVVGALVLIPFLGTERAQSLFQTGTGTGFFRVSVWQAGAEMIRDHPIFGVGLDNFLYEYPRYMPADAWREPNLSHPHNIVLDFWVRMGLLGLAALVWMVVEFYRRGLRQLTGPDRALALGLVAGMTAALVHGLMDASYFYVDLAFVWMLLLALMAGFSRRAGT